MSNEIILDDIQVSFGENISDKTFKPAKLGEIFDAIKTDETLKNKISKLRLAGKEEEFKKIKSSLPYFNLGIFENNRRANDALIETRFMLFDYDKLEDLEGLKEKLLSDERLFSLFISPSGKGIKCIYMLDRPITSHVKFTEIYTYYRNEFTERFDVEPDTTSDAVRICFFSYDPELFLNVGALPLSADIDCITMPSEMIDENYIKPVEIASRNNYLISILGSLIYKGLSVEEALNYARGWNITITNPLGDDEIVNTVKRAYKNYGDDVLAKKCKEYFSYDSTVIRVGVVGDEFSMSKIGKEKFLIQNSLLKKVEQDRYYSYLVKNKHIQNLRAVNYMATIDLDKSYFEYDANAGEINVHIAPYNGGTEDNAFIENYLSKTFKEHKAFIKKWLAVYFYTNYQKLPFLIIQGERGVGKNKFAESLMSVFPSLSRITRELNGHFNPGADKKLLIVDEMDSQGKVQYTSLKKLSGQGMIEINEKFVKQYQVRNNLNLIILSNEIIPISVDRNELPTDEKNNQFFVFRMTKSFDEFDSTIQQKLEKRWLHYIRTELKSVFDSLDFTGYRYSIPTPITDEEKKLFELNTTDLDYAVDEVVTELFKDALSVTSRVGKWIKAGLLPKSCIPKNYRYKDVTSHKIVTQLNSRGYLAGEGGKKMISGERLECYKLGQRFTTELKKLKEETPPFSIEL